MVKSAICSAAALLAVDGFRVMKQTAVEASGVKAEAAARTGVLGNPVHHDYYNISGISDFPSIQSSINWIIGAEGMSCNQACWNANLGSCSESQLRGLTSSSAAASAFRSAGVQCTSNNTWDYGYGVSQCTSLGCCGGNCVGSCSTAQTQGCGATSSSAHGRLCPCGRPVAKRGFNCAVENDQMQKSRHPKWRYVSRNGDHAYSSARQPVTTAWEPILEAVPQCIVGRRKEFKFLVGLDKTWVDYYNRNRQYFSNQGYNSIEASARMWFDHSSYLYEQQFNIRLSISRVYAMPELDTHCRAEGYADGPGNTSIVGMLSRRGVSMRSIEEAGIVRLGVGISEQYCHSYAGVGSLCSHYPTVMQAKPFNDRGHMNMQSAVTFAHEIAHAMDVCTDVVGCDNTHTQNEVPDIMVWNGMPIRDYRQEGMFYKFMSTCTHVYTTSLCKKARMASCGRQ